MNQIDTFKNQLNHRGFTLFEFTIVILLIGVMMSFAIDRLLQLQIDAERTSVQQIIGTLSSAVNLQVAELVVEHGLESIKSLENTNPMNYLSELPYNYSGNKSDKDAGQHASGIWYFDSNQSVLVYKVKNTNYFESTLKSTPRIRLKVMLISKDKTRRHIRGVTVKSLNNYHWKKY